MPELPTASHPWTCDRVRRAAHEWLLDELAPAAAWAVGHHVERCAGCAQEVERARRYGMRMRRIATRERAPSELRERLAESLRRHRPPRG